MRSNNSKNDQLSVTCKIKRKNVLVLNIFYKMACVFHVTTFVSSEYIIALRAAVTLLNDRHTPHEKTETQLE